MYFGCLVTGFLAEPSFQESPASAEWEFENFACLVCLCACVRRSNMMQIRHSPYRSDANEKLGVRVRERERARLGEVYSKLVF